MINEPRMVPFLNNSGETIPAHAVLKGTEVTNGVVQASKPDGDGSTGVWYVNGPVRVLNGGYGACTKENPVWVLYDDADAVVNGDEWGPQNGSWELKKGNVGFVAGGGASGGRAWFEFKGGGEMLPDPTGANWYVLTTNTNVWTKDWARLHG